MKPRHLILAFITLIMPPGFGWQAGESDLAEFFQAVGQVESGHDDDALGKDYEVGRYQITFAYHSDAEDRLKTGRAWTDVTDKAYAERIMHAYYKRWEPAAYHARDYETLSRLHNSGPGWAKKKHKTDAYWNKVKAELDKNSP